MLPLYRYRVTRADMKPLSIFRSAILFAVSGEIAEAPIDHVEEGLAKNAFRASVSAISKEARSGWCSPQDVFSTDFADRNDWSFGQYVILSLRVEQRKIQKVRMDALLRNRVSAWCREHEKERCPAAVRAELREAVEAELLLQTPPTLRVYSAIWNLPEGYLALQGCPERVADAFRRLFHRSFGLAMEERGFFDEADEEAREDLSEPFKAWLLRREDEGRGQVDLGEGASATWWSDGGIVLVGESGRYSAPVDSLAASSALAQGDAVEKLPLTVKRSDREYACSLGRNGRKLGLKLPSVVRGADAAEQLYEATFLYEEHEAILRSAFEQFQRERDAQGPQGVAAEKRWRKGRLERGWEALVERLRKAEEP